MKVRFGDSYRGRAGRGLFEVRVGMDLMRVRVMVKVTVKFRSGSGFRVQPLSLSMQGRIGFVMVGVRYDRSG